MTKREYDKIKQVLSKVRRLNSEALRMPLSIQGWRINFLWGIKYSYLPERIELGWMEFLRYAREKDRFLVGPKGRLP